MLHLGQTDKGRCIRVFVADGVLVGRRGALELAQVTVALGHLEGHFAAQGALLLLGQLVIHLAVGALGVVVLAALHLLVGYGQLGAAAGAHAGKQRRGYYISYNMMDVHTLKT